MFGTHNTRIWSNKLSYIEVSIMNVNLHTSVIIVRKTKEKCSRVQLLCLNHRVYTILKYNPAISTMAATTMTDQSKKEAFCSHASSIRTQALSFTLKPVISGMKNIKAKIQEPEMITWNRKAQNRRLFKVIPSK